jgi:predicted nucleotidyltransferase component of viral defense system
VKEFFDQLNQIVNPGRIDIIEKDYHLHRLLYQISHDDYLKDALVFKAGTCLVKAYMGYYRFSEDIDFTWKDTTLWKEKSANQTRKTCSKLIDIIIDRLKEITKKHGFVFNGEKTDISQVEIGSGGRMVRFFIGYHSDILQIPATVKIEINFVDQTLFAFKNKKLQSLISTVKNKELKFLYKEEWDEYKKDVSIACYDPREIFTDKVRAAMTRVSYKFRDVIDIYKLEQKYGYTMVDYQEQIRKKTDFVLDLYRRYKDNLESSRIPDIETIPERELNLLLFKQTQNFYENINRIHTQLKDMQKEILHT